MCRFSCGRYFSVFWVNTQGARLPDHMVRIYLVLHVCQTVFRHGGTISQFHQQHRKGPVSSSWQSWVLLVFLDVSHANGSVMASPRYSCFCSQVPTASSIAVSSSMLHLFRYFAHFEIMLLIFLSGFERALCSLDDSPSLGMSPASIVSQFLACPLFLNIQQCSVICGRGYKCLIIENLRKSLLCKLLLFSLGKAYFLSAGKL